MAANKRVRRPRSRNTKDLLAETPAPLTAADLKKHVHRLEVEIAATSRIAAEQHHRRADLLPPPDPLTRGRGYGVQQRLTYAQSRKRRARRLMQVSMFLVSSCLLAGAGAWLFRFWQEMH